MHTRVVSSLAILLVGLTTTAYAGGYYHGDHYYAGNINGAPVSAKTYTTGTYIYENPGLNSEARGAELFVNNDGNHKKFGLLNKNYGPVRSITDTTSHNADVRDNSISAASFGALTSIKSEGRGNRFFTLTGNKGYVAAETTTSAHTDVNHNEISTTAVGSYTGIESEGPRNFFLSFNGNWGNVRATTLTEAWEGVLGNEISTVAIGAETSFKSVGNGNHGLFFNINDGDIRALTTTFADDQIHENTIDTTAVGASLSINDTKVGGGQDTGRFYRRGHNGFGSLNLNFGNVLAQTNTDGYAVSGNTINTFAAGASTSITTGYSRRSE